MSLKFVRKYYGVPARRGAKVARMGRKGEKQYGTITGGQTTTVNVRWKGHLFSEWGINPKNLEFFPEEKQ